MALYSLANQAGALFRSALNTVLGKLQRNYYGTTDPASVNESTAGMFWVDSGTGTPQLKIRNGSDNGWIGLFDLDATRLYTTLFSRLRVAEFGSEGGIDCVMSSGRFLFNPDGGATTFQLIGGVNALIGMPLRPFTGGTQTIGTSAGRFQGSFFVTAPNVSSDWRLKEGFAPYTDTDLAAARLFQPQTFRLKATGEPTSGYVAQQIISAFEMAGLSLEEAVQRPVDLGLMAKGEDGMWGVHYELVNALRIEALFRVNVDARPA
jgi:hypothetical protein